MPPLFPAADAPVLTASGTTSSLHQEFRGRVTLLSFIYASCSDVNGCPLATAVFQKLRVRILERPALAERLQLVSLSFDPARDTPEQMRRYGESFARGGLDWSFLTTRDEATLQPILEAYGQTLVQERDAAGNPLGPIAHILRVYLIDRDQQVRNVYTVSFLHPETLLADVETLLLEERGRAQPPGTAAAVEAPVSIRPGDDRRGYEQVSYRTRSRALDARGGERADLLSRVSEPPLGLPHVPVPIDNPLTREKVELGRRLFFDRRLSHNQTFSCAICHVPEQGFTSNELRTPVGIEGRTVRRNAPTLLNVAYAESLFHDGRETTLERQVWGPLLAHNEMGNPSMGVLLDRIARVPGYPDLFDAAFPGRGLDVQTLGMALASYERTLVAADAPYDRWRARAGSALSPGARRGFEIFAGRADCAACHPLESPLLSDGDFHNTGIGYTRAMRPSRSGKQRVQVAPGTFLEVDRSIVAAVSAPVPNDLGRYEITGDPGDRWRYRTPTLRNVALTAPYMHDGSLETLAEVVDFYDRGGVPNPGLDPRIRPLGLSARERDDLVAFLEALTASDLEPLVRDAFAAPVGERD